MFINNSFRQFFFPLFSPINCSLFFLEAWTLKQICDYFEEEKKETHIVNQYSDWIISRVLCHHWIYIFFMINGGIAEWLKEINIRGAICNILFIAKTPCIHIHTIFGTLFIYGYDVNGLTMLLFPFLGYYKIALNKSKPSDKMKLNKINSQKKSDSEFGKWQQESFSL